MEDDADRAGDKRQLLQLARKLAEDKGAVYSDKPLSEILQYEPEELSAEDRILLYWILM